MAIDAAITHNQLSAAEALFRLHGVVGYSSAYQPKIIGGRITTEACIRVYVKHKVSKSLCVLTRRLIPKTIDNVITDVVDVQGEPIFLESPISTTDPTSRHRPVVGGISTIGPWGGINCPHEERRSAGTVTITALNEKDEPRVLSCYHVWNNSGPDELCAERGDPCIQPGGIDGGRCPDDVFGTLEDWEDLNGATGQEEFDSAIVKPTDPSMVKVGEVLGAGQVTAFRNPKRTDRPSLYGRSSRVIHNIFFADLFATFRVQGYGCRSGKFYSYFRNQTMFSPPCIGGDSGGGLIVKEGAEQIILGQAFAGTQGIGIASKIEPIFKRFKLHLQAEDGDGDGNGGEDDIAKVELKILRTGIPPIVKEAQKVPSGNWKTKFDFQALGGHNLSATAWSKNGDVGYSEPVMIEIEENGVMKPVKVKIIYPKDGQKFKKGEREIEIEASYEGQF